jgi:hypothetical protein
MFGLRIKDTVEPKVTCVQVLVVGGGIVAPLLTVVIALVAPPLRARIGWVLGGLLATVAIVAALAGLLAGHTFMLTVDGPLVRVSRRGRTVFRCRLDRPFGARVDVSVGAAEEEVPFRILLEQDGARFCFAARGDPALWRGLPFVVEVDPEEELLGVAEPTLVEGEAGLLLERLRAAGDRLQFLPLWPWEEVLRRLWSEYQPDVLLGEQSFGHVRLQAGDEDEFLIVTDEEVATAWFRWPREATTAVARERLAGRGVEHEIELLHEGERFTFSTTPWMSWDEARAVAHFINGDRPPVLREG